jgi:hypothetical protein
MAGFDPALLRCSFIHYWWQRLRTTLFYNTVLAISLFQCEGDFGLTFFCNFEATGLALGDDGVDDTRGGFDGLFSSRFRYLPRAVGRIATTFVFI